MRGNRTIFFPFNHFQISNFLFSFAIFRTVAFLNDFLTTQKYEYEFYGCEDKRVGDTYCKNLKASTKSSIAYDLRLLRQNA